MHGHDLIRVRHMLEAAREGVTFAANKERLDLEGDRMLTLVPVVTE